MSSEVTSIPHPVSATLVERPWGGRRLARLVGRAGEEPTNAIGEAWLAGPDSIVADGPDAGRTLESLAKEHGADFVGASPARRHGARMPLLVKLLDAAEPLSIQVHPDDDHALRAEAASGHLGKDEAWLVLAAVPGAAVLRGWTRAVDAAEVRAAVAAGRLPELLREVPVSAGDVVVNEAGTVHAVGAGILLYELQQASDLTYRLYDHGRVGADGRARELHLDPALAVARLGAEAGGTLGASPVGAGRERLAATGTFTMERWRVGRGAPARQEWRVDPRSLEIWTALDGEAELTAGGVTIHLPTFATAILPAGAGAASLQGEATLARGTS